MNHADNNDSLIGLVMIQFIRVNFFPCQKSSGLITGNFSTDLFLVMQMLFFKKAIEDMAANSLRCVAIAYRTYDWKDIPSDEENLTKWALPEDELILLAIVGLKVHFACRKPDQSD